jgi:hypothetical protein
MWGRVTVVKKVLPIRVIVIFEWRYAAGGRAGESGLFPSVQG